MIGFFKTVNGKIAPLKAYEEGCWINCKAPQEDEIDYLIQEFEIETDILKSALDEEESSRIENDNGTILITLDSPVVERYGKNLTYYTMPLSIIITPKNVITISLRENNVISEFEDGLIKNVDTELKVNFALNIAMRMATKYLYYLKQIKKISGHVEEELKKSMKNNELIQLLEIEKSLVYLSSSLKASNSTLQKIMGGRYIKLGEDDSELLEDAIIEIRQAIEMSEIYLSILSGTTDAFGSIISNNLNDVMKMLASITLVISISSVVSGIYGMNVAFPASVLPWWVPLAIIATLSAIAIYILKKKDML